MSGKSLAVIGMLLLFIVGVLGFFLIKKLLSLFFRPSHVQKIINGLQWGVVILFLLALFYDFIFGAS
tara:strand:- start:273 stop:473 length:201 start_codon:yes stop_codon:yes gene_type:complete